MTNFLEGYEDVNTRIKRFWTEFPNGRLAAYIEDINIEKGWILVKAEAYKDAGDPFPAAIDFAFEIRSDKGVNANFWVENCTTSAYGRVIGALTPSDVARSTRQDMEKVERLTSADVKKLESEDPWSKPFGEDGFQTASSAISEIAKTLGGTLTEQAPACDHGHRVWREGMKNGRAWANYSCVEKVRANQCAPIWFVLQSDGVTWKPQD